MSFTFPAKREEGQGLIEYALILVLVSIAVIVILTLLGSSINVVMARVNGAMTGQALTNTGREYLIVGLDADVTSNDGGATCSYSINNMSVMGFQNGDLADDGNLNVQYAINGSNRNSVVSLDDTVNETGSLGSGTVPCPVRVTAPNGYSKTLNP